MYFNSSFPLAFPKKGEGILSGKWNSGCLLYIYRDSTGQVPDGRSTLSHSVNLMLLLNNTASSLLLNDPDEQHNLYPCGIALYVIHVLLSVLRYWMRIPHWQSTRSSGRSTILMQVLADVVPLPCVMFHLSIAYGQPKSMMLFTQTLQS